MARPGVTEYDVHKTAAKLIEKGINPTVDSIRQELGTGSRSTIGPLLKAWKAKQENWKEVKETGLPSSLIGSVKGLYDSIRDEAEETIRKVREQAQEQIESAYKKEKAQRDVNAGLTEDNRQLDRDLSAARTEIEALKTQLKEQEKDNTELQKKHDEALIKAEFTERENLTLSEKIKHEQKVLESFMSEVEKQKRIDREDYTQMKATLERSLSQAQRENQMLLDQVERAEIELKKNSNAIEQLNASCKQAKSELTSLEKTHEKTTSKVDELNKEVARLQKELSAITSKFDNANDALTSEKIKTGTLQDKLTTSESRCDQMQDKINQLDDRLLFLAQEKAALKEQLKIFQKGFKK